MRLPSGLITWIINATDASARTFSWAPVSVVWAKNRSKSVSRIS